MLKRAIVDILILASISIFHWWFAIVCAIVAAIYFERYYELIFFGLIIDLLYSAPIPGYRGVEFFVAYACIAGFFVIEYIKHRTRFSH